MSRWLTCMTFLLLSLCPVAGWGALSVTPSMYDFERVILSRSGELDILVSNDGDLPVNIGVVGLVEALADPFFVTSDGCSERRILPRSNCRLFIRFTPWTAGFYAGALDIPYQEDGRLPTTTRLQVQGEGFIVPGNLPPEVPVLIHPDAEQDNLRTSVVFRWQRCDDPDGDAVGYWLFLSRSPDFAEATVQRLDPGRIRLSGMGGAAALLLLGAALPQRRGSRVACVTLFLIALLAACGDSVEDNGTVPAYNLEEKTTYYWKVVSDDGRGGLSESEVRSFTTR